MEDRRHLGATLASAPRHALRTGAAIVVASLALWAAAKIQVPFWPVPMTLQTLVVLLIGGMLGARAGMVAVALYLVEGALGLPVFAGTPERGIGLAYMAGPTGGYLTGYLAAAAVTGWLTEKGGAASLPRAFATALIGVAVIYGFGLAWLAGLVGFERAIAVGLVPFLLGETLKVAIAAVAIHLVRSRRAAGLTPGAR